MKRSSLGAQRQLSSLQMLEFCGGADKRIVERSPDYCRMAGVAEL